MVYALISGMQLDGKPIAGFQLGNDDYRKIEVEDPTPDGGLYMNHDRALVSGRRIKLDHVPKQMKLDGGTVIADYTSYNGFLCVADKFKNVVESVEPGVHQFIPFEAVGADKNHIANLWIMVLCNRLDGVDREHTTMILNRGVIWCPVRDMVRRGEELPAGVDPNVSARLVLNLSQIGNHHIWFDKHHADSHPLASDEIVAALRATGVTGVSYEEVEAV
jgi:hypothetical protein